jgi:2-haloacid dehalogenase
MDGRYGYFNRGNVDIDTDHIITCDDIGVGKPEIRAYEKVKEKIRAGDDDELWYAAAHGWDVSAAGRAGFKTAYCTILEKEALEDIFGKSNVVAESLEGLAEKVVASEG